MELATNEHASAKHLQENMKPMPIEVICYLSQQATEKSLKAVLFNQNKPVPTTHNINELLELVNKNGIIINLSQRDANRITRFATRTRYAETRIEASEKDAEYAVKTAGGVVKQAQEIISKGIDPTNTQNQPTSKT